MTLFIQIAIWLLSYFLSKKAGATSGQAALIASGATLLSNATGLTDTLADGISNWYGGSGDATDPVKDGATGSVTNGTMGGTIGVVGSGTGSTTGISDVLKSWGPAGTALVGATTVGALTDNKWLLYGGLAVLAVLILK